MRVSAPHTRVRFFTVTAALLSTLAVGAQAQALTPAAGASDAAAAAVPATGQAGSGRRFVPDASRPLVGGAASAKTHAGAAPALAPADAPPISEVSGECPSGTARMSTLYTDSFEKGTLPEPNYTANWTAATGGARTGSYYARSIINTADASSIPSSPPYWPLAIPLVQSPGGRTILRFAIKGTYAAETAYVGVNNAQGWAAPSADWGIVTLDVTNSILPEDQSWLDVRFANYPAVPATNSEVDIDDVEVYTCTPKSNTRGDFTGDGIGDVVTVNGSGILQVWPGRGDFHLASPLSVGVGWGSMNWLGSPGDVNLDGRADMMARDTSGNLYIYYGDGIGGFSAGSKLIGTGWGPMSSITPMGDLDGDGRIDILACNGVTGELRRYWFTSPSGGLTGSALVGTYFNGFRTLFTMGDYNGDGRWDMITILQNGDMRVYTVLPSGSLYGWGVRIGTYWLFGKMSSPASFNRDGWPDVLGLDDSGNLWTYPTYGGGSWGGRVLTGTYFQQFRLIL